MLRLSKSSHLDVYASVNSGYYRLVSYPSSYHNKNLTCYIISK